MLLFHLSGENLDLAREEVLALAENKKFIQIKNILLLNSTYNKIFERLGFTHGIFDVFFESDSRNLMQDIMCFNFNRYYKKDFKVKIINFKGEIDFDEKKLGSIIYKKLIHPKVNLSNPITTFFFIFAANKIFCCRLIKRIEKSFCMRKPHMKPEMHPTSLSPKLARVLINLSGIKKGVLLDPFCGSGGILVEAGLMGLKPVGFDIDNIMLKRAEINLRHYGAKDYVLKLQDAVGVRKKYDHIVSELPFGKNSRISNELEKLYSDFLKTLKEVLAKRAVLVFPFDVRKLIKKNGFKIINEFDYYIHKSMTKKIYILK